MAERGSEIWDSGRARVGWPDYSSHANVLPPLLGPSQACVSVSVWGGGGLTTGHSCFPFLLNHTVAIWMRLSLHSPAELLRWPRLSLCRQAWPSEPWPLPSAPVADPLRPSSRLLTTSGTLQVLDAAHVDMLVCVRRVSTLLMLPVLP